MKRDPQQSDPIADLELALRSEAGQARRTPARALRVRTLAALCETARSAPPHAPRQVFRWFPAVGLATGLAAAALALAFILRDAPQRERSISGPQSKAIATWDRILPRQSSQPERALRFDDPLQREARLLAQDARAVLVSFQQALPAALRDEMENATGVSR